MGYNSKEALIVRWALFKQYLWSYLKMNEEYTLEKYVDDIIQYLMNSSYKYSLFQAREVVGVDFDFIVKSYNEKISAYDTAIEIGYCCG